jgi:ATP-GRASP peptide maturase of grasp-with-spasm system
MVIIYSIDFDVSTNDVIDWLFYKKVPFVRYNEREIIPDTEWALTITSDHRELKIKDTRPNDITGVWFRRHGEIELPNILEKINNNDIYTSAKKNLFKELQYGRAAFYGHFSQYKHLNTPDKGNVDKIHCLNQAVQAGLKVPATILTNSKKELIEFYHKHEKIISKSIFNIDFFKDGDQTFLPYTSIIDFELINQYENKFFLSLFQKYIEKDFEIRAFYLDRKVYSMAIFSQTDKQTEVDFRRYNRTNPNRTVPFKLPRDIEEKILDLSDKMDVNCGSIDLIKGIDGEYYFLELNPVGQFGMTSIPCNYFLEREIAAFLSNNSVSKGN